MKKIDILGLLRNKDGVGFENGCRVVDRPNVIDIKKESVEAVLVVSGMATVICSNKRDKESAVILKGEICFFGDGDEYVMPQEGSMLLVVDKAIKMKEPSEKTRFNIFGKKSKEKKQSNITGDQDHTLAEEKKEKSLLIEVMPKVRQIWYQAMGPLSESIVNDEEKFKSIAETVYFLLPKPIQLIVKPELFVKFCYENRHIFIVEACQSEQQDETPLLAGGNNSSEPPQPQAEEEKR
ncbi:hypothetical protein ACFQH5_16535 [Halomonas salifodinae]|uniref:Uncharacterized protein n=1 Tax=Halomonas salifodinae TaxID=438745 RepID=A0ABW2F272_9GAMM